MKIHLYLENWDRWNCEQNSMCADQPIEIEWNLPVLPQMGEMFDCDTICPDKMPPFHVPYDPTWIVDLVNFRRINGVIVPIIWLSAE